MHIYCIRQRECATAIDGQMDNTTDTVRPVEIDPISSSCHTVPAHGLCLQPMDLGSSHAGLGHARAGPGLTVLQVLPQFFKTNSNI